MPKNQKKYKFLSIYVGNIILQNVISFFDSDYVRK